MLSLTSLILWTTCMASPIVFSHEVTHYGSLIKNIYDKYGRTGVIIASATSHLSFEKTSTWHELTGMLSNEGISALIIDFRQFENRLKVYIEKTYPPLIVIDLDTVEALHSFEIITKNADMSYSVWLIFFSGDVDHDVCKYCREPHGNLFNLNFGSKALISCCASKMIEEWWSTQKNHTKRQNVARLTNENPGIVWFSQKLISDGRQSMDGQILRVTALADLQIKNKRNKDLYGDAGKFLAALSTVMNFTVPNIIWEKTYGAWNRETSKWTGILGRIHRQEADLSINSIVMTSERSNIIRFTTPIMSGVYQLHFRKLDSARFTWDAYFKVFAADVWIVIIGLILTAPIVLTLIEWNARKSHFLPLLAKHYSFVWGIYCQQGLSDFPDETPLRIIYISLMMSALVVSATYGASFMSILAVSSSFSPFSSMEEFAGDGRYKFIVPRNSSSYYEFKNSNLTLMKKMMSLMKPVNSLPQTFVEGFQQVCKDRVALYTHEFRKRLLSNLIPCEITSINTGKMETVAMIVPRNSPYIEPINHFIQELTFEGIFRKLVKNSNPQHYEYGFQPAHLQGITPLIVVWISGVLIASFIFIFERTSYLSTQESHIRNRRGTKNNAKHPH
ncbi:probable glutamate receptor [Diachasma alloeum]|uniref:Ionotropic receptor 110 n=1 Tax=Diachasma alloeum TaxID=454923 RepID=A0A4E0S3R5_9HYME|nr:probable glutamate receptor [Diachasma alloeum]THK33005.1 ionotropic receptor 110 [Diachasma alloeum]